MKKVIKDLKQYFDIRELVCPMIFEKWGERAWSFFRPELLVSLYLLRTEIIKEPMIVNNWHNGGNITQRGLRCNQCQLVREKTLQGTLYTSAHLLGAGIDVVFSKISAEEARNRIRAEKHRLPTNSRIEKAVNWLHFDVYDFGEKLYEF